MNETPEEILQRNYLKERDEIVGMGHPLAPHFTDTWRGTVRNIFKLYRIQKDIEKDWESRRYSPNATMIDSWDPRTRTFVRRRADECNELRRRRTVADARRQADILSGFAGDLLLRISTTEETRAVAKAFLNELNGKS